MPSRTVGRRRGPIKGLFSSSCCRSDCGGGRFPHPKLLEKHGLASMLPLVQAVKVGDLRTFNNELKRHQRALVCGKRAVSAAGA